MIFSLRNPLVIFSATAVLLATVSTPALSAIEPLPFWNANPTHKAWTKLDGAPVAAAAMMQDRTGMLWFAAADGLFRFDGVRFERVVEIGGNKLLSPNVRALEVFGDALWIGYAFGGISVFENGTVRHYGEADGLPSGSISQFGKTADGTRWVYCSRGVYWLDGAKWRQALPESVYGTFAELQDGTLLVSHANGLFRSVPGTHQFRKLPVTGAIDYTEVSVDGSVVLKRFGQTPRIFDPVTETATPLQMPAAIPTPVAIHRDRRNAWWIATGNGVQLYDLNFQAKQLLLAPQSFSGTGVYTTPLNDREGNLWFATENGVDRIRNSRLTLQPLPPFYADFIVTAGADGEVWVGSNSTKETIAPNAFAIAADGHRIESDMPSPSASTRGADGSLWFGDTTMVWRRHAGKLARWPLPPALKGQPVQALALANDGQLWASVIQRGVHVLKDGVWLPGGGYAELAGRTAVSLHADANGRIWIGYPNNAMAMLHDGKIQQFGPADGLALGNVLAIFSRRGMLWIGGDQGLARFDGRRFVAVNDSAGRPFTGVSGIVETAAGELWLHDANGLVRIGATELASALADGRNRVATERIDYLDGYRGMAAQMRPLGSLVEATDGRLWYATNSSVGWIDPHRIDRNRLAPTPLITWLSTDNVRHPAISGLGLPQHTRNLQIDFTAAVLSIPERARFRTRLIGQDHTWRDSGARRQAFYTNLGPGDYRFEVMAANEDGVWSVAPASVAFTIAPAFYQTNWFKALCAVLVAGAMSLLYRWRLSRMTARVVELMHERLEERERIARTLHDTYLQSVQGLILRFNRIKAVLPKEHVVRQEIDAALELADAVNVEGRDQLMELRASEPIDAAMAQVLETAGAAACAQHGVVFSLHEHGVRRELQASVQDELLAIAKEALTNALRHSGSDTVELHLTYGAASFTLEVRDHGIGLDDEVRKAGRLHRHWGLAGMRERAARIGARLALDSTRGKGTAVVVTLRARQCYA
jgi:signal transduction histidine kinase/ligand-binding sensor domain-containing protein